MNFETATKRVMSTVLGDFAKNIQRQRNEGFGWRFDGIDDWTTEAIFAKLHELGVDTDAERFHDQARAAGEIKTLENDWHRQASDDDQKDIGLWNDFSLFAVPVLWERLAKNILCWELIERGMYRALDAEEHNEPLPDVNGKPDHIAAITGLLDYLEPLPDDQQVKQWEAINSGYYEYGGWLEDVMYEEAGDRPEFSLRIANLLSNLDGHSFADIKAAEILAQLGRTDEAVTRVRAALERYPGDFNILQRAAEIYTQLGDDAEAIRLWIESIPRADDLEGYEEAFASLEPAMERAGRGGELEELRRLHHAPPPPIIVERKSKMPLLVDELPYEPPPPVETPMPIRVEKKIGRNDPCPCGSGKKYKKCCLE